MKNLIAALCLMALPAAAIELKPVDESTYATRIVSAARGKVLLVNFWATYCVPCRKEMPAIIALAEKYKAKGLVFVTVSADEPEQMKDAVAYLEKVKAPTPTFVKQAKNEDKFSAAIDPKWSGALPATFLYDKTGQKARSFFGEVKLAELEAALKKLL